MEEHLREWPTSDRCLELTCCQQPDGDIWVGQWKVDGDIPHGRRRQRLHQGLRMVRVTSGSM